MGYLAKLLLNNGITPICSFISPTEVVRNEIANFFEENEFFLIHVNTPLVECEKRDTKGMYLKARQGIIKDFTGIDAIYEVPIAPNMTIDTTNQKASDLVPMILEHSKRTKERAKKVSIFVGRWNGVFHNGHMHIIQQKLDNCDHDILMLIRDVEPDKNNPWTASQVKTMLDFVFAGNDRVSSIIIPDVASVEYGRGVGYEVNEIKVTQNIAGISGTGIRKQISTGQKDWYELVPEKVKDYFNDNQ